MKTILTICGESLLIPHTEGSQLLNALKGAVRVHRATCYGPDEHRYDEDWGYAEALVAEGHPARMRVELVPDGEVLNQAEWTAAEAAAAKLAAAQAAKRATEPAAALSGAA